MGLLGFSEYYGPNPFSSAMPLGSIQPVTNMSIGNLSGDEGLVASA
jgi:hypothetical protein